MIDVLLAVLFSLLAVVNAAALAIFFYPERKSHSRFCPPLSVIIPAHNEEKFIAGTINSALDARYKNRREVIVVDDGSTDRTSDVVKSVARKNRNVRLFRIPHSGKSAAINHGIRMARFGTIAYVDADSSLEKNSLIELVRPLAERNTVISTGIIRARQTKNPLTWFQDIDYISSSSWRYVCSKVRATYVAPGFAAFKKRAVVKIGGFSSDTLTEDIDTAIILRRAGHGAAMTKAVIFTSVPSTLKSLVRQRMRWGRGTIQVAKKHSDIIFSPKTSTVGMYSFPMHLFWYAFALLYLPFALYWIASSYLSSVTSILSAGTLVFLLKWFTVYGILDLFYQVYTGAYALTPLLASVLISWSLSFVYLLASFKKFSAYSWKLLAYVVMFPYYWLMFTIQALALVYESASAKRSSNVWKKHEGNL